MTERPTELTCAPAYVQAYHIQDHNRDGFIDESDAMIQYPQGHGDAWGHYLTAIKAQYELLHHPYFKWESRSELYNLQDIVIDVDYRDERKFADIAAAKARCGAKLVNSVYREAYTEDPEGQWQGYIDTDEDRAWGVEGWAKRAGQGALFDWLTGNALLPDEHPDHEFDNIQKVDRHTVTELDSIATQLARIETAMDAANSGLNPLGVSPDAVPFDIDSFFLTQDEHLGRSQFTQVYERALTALQNAKATFDYANKLDNMIRRASNEYTDFSWNIEQQDRDFRNRLIAYFGTPYAGTIGAGKLFPEGYYGPDLITYQYVDVREINNDTTPGLHSTYELFLRKLRTGFDGGTTNSPVSIAIKKSELGWHGLDDAKASAYKEKFAFLFDRDFPSPNLDLIIPTSTDYFDRNLVQLHLPRQAKGYSFQALGNWGQRAATGSIQEAIREMLLVEADLFNAIAEYDGMVGWFTRDYNDLIQLAELARESEERLNDKIEKMKGFRAGMIVADHVSMGSEIAGDLIKDLADAIGDSVPDDQTAGTSNSIPTFLGMPIKIAGVVGKAPFSILSLLAADASAALELEQDVLFEEIEKQQQNAEFEFDVIQETHDLLNNLGDEPMARISVFAAQERHRRAADALRTQILEANNLLQEREVFNRKTASVTQRQRYQDMTFRVYRNDALRKYQQAFDLAARYAYLAAKAYDYETNLDPDHPASARGLYSDIVSTTSLGATTMQGQPIVGPRGLADILGRMNANYEHLANQFGFRNFATETHTFSLRRELMRIQSDSSKDKNFRQALAEARVDDLWQVPEFRRHCRPIASPEDGPQPGIVLPIPTHIATGKNFFGKTLAGGDSAYDPSNYSTRIYGLNTTFDNYDSVRMAATPRVYLVPTGHDLMYIPDATSLRTRAWKIEDQAIPAPYNIGTHELELPDWLPIADSLSSRIAEIRRHPTFLAGTDPDAVPLNTRLIGRSVWNTRWVLIIPGVSLLGDGKDGIDTLIYGGLKSGKTVTADDYDPVGDRDGNGVKDIRLTIQSYSYSGI